MNIIVGDRFIYKKSRYRTGLKAYVVEVKRITLREPTVASDGETIDRSTYEVQTIVNALTGKKYKTTINLGSAQLSSLEEFIDEKRAFIKELETYL